MKEGRVLNLLPVEKGIIGGNVTNKMIRRFKGKEQLLEEGV
jgi:hypothetical protein